MYKVIVRNILFLFDPEKVHYFSFFWIKKINQVRFLNALIKHFYAFEHPKLERTVFGLTFKNPVGLAAGFDKDAVLVDELANFGFGFTEIGTLTPKPQDGNPKKRLFRLVKDQAIINRMGFNNKGVIQAIEQLKTRKSNIIVGGNIGKNKATENEDALSDYSFCFQALYPYVDYFAVNVSSPNTPNLRDLQEKAPLTHLLSELMKLNNAQPIPKPILLKIAPDLSQHQLDDIIDIINSTKIAGVIATNTTIERGNLLTDTNKVTEIGNGGVSGKPLKDKSTEVIKYLHKKSNGAFPIIGVGGISSPEDAIEKLEAGASLVQIYTGFIYEGPGFVKRINKAILSNGK